MAFSIINSEKVFFLSKKNVELRKKMPFLFNYKWHFLSSKWSKNTLNLLGSRFFGGHTYLKNLMKSRVPLYTEFFCHTRPILETFSLAENLASPCLQDRSYTEWHYFCPEQSNHQPPKLSANCLKWCANWTKINF